MNCQAGEKEGQRFTEVVRENVLVASVTKDDLLWQPLMWNSRKNNIIGPYKIQTITPTVVVTIL